MSKEIRPKNSELDEESRDLLEIETLAEALDQIAGTALEKAVRIGELLSKHRKRFPKKRPPDGEMTWEQWVDIHLPFSARQAARYMQIHRSYSDENVRINLEAEWKRINTGRDAAGQQASLVREKARRKAQRELEEESEHGITDETAFRRCNTLWTRAVQHESQRGKERIARIMVAFLVDAYQIDLKHLPAVRIYMK